MMASLILILIFTLILKCIIELILMPLLILILIPILILILILHYKGVTPFLSIFNHHTPDQRSGIYASI